MLDNIPEYREMRKGLTALRLEVSPSIADDLLSRCERAALAIFEAGRMEERKLDQECREALG